MAIDRSIEDKLREEFEARHAARENRASLKPGDGEGTSGGMSDDWKESVDRQLTQLHGDVRNLLYGLVGGFLLIAAGGFSLYKSLADEQAAQKADIARIEGKIETMDARLSGKLDLLLDRKERDAKQ